MLDQEMKQISIRIDKSLAEIIREKCTIRRSDDRADMRVHQSDHFNIIVSKMGRCNIGIKSDKWKSSFYEWLLTCDLSDSDRLMIISKAESANLLESGGRVEIPVKVPKTIDLDISVETRVGARTISVALNYSNNPDLEISSRWALLLCGMYAGICNVPLIIPIQKKKSLSDWLFGIIWIALGIIATLWWLEVTKYFIRWGW